MSELPTPITREEIYLDAIAEDDASINLPTPNTREEIYLNAIANSLGNADLPTPITREEMYLYEIAGGGGGGGEQEEKSVVFVDHEGVVARYTPTELKAMTEFPEPKEYEGLTFDCWNWSLENAKQTVDSRGELIIGANYHTTDNKLHLFVKIPETKKTHKFGFASESGSTITIDFGDGSSEETLSGAGSGTVKYVSHTFEEGGSYVIKIGVSDGNNIYLSGNSSNAYSYLTGSTYAESISSANIIEKIETPSNVIVSKYAFANMSMLNVVSVSSTMEFGDNYGYNFYSCTSLGGFVFPKNSTFVPPNLFQINCPASFISTNDSIEKIYDYSFYELYNLTNIVIPDTVEEIGRYAFAKCYSLKKIILPTALAMIGESAFDMCYRLEDIVLQNGITRIDGSVFSQTTSLKNLIIPSTVTSFGSDNLYMCSSLNEFSINSVFIPARTCTNSCLKKLSLGENVVTISQNSFSSCFGLSEVVIPSSVTTIESGAFGFCYSLHTIKFSRSTPPTIYSTTFSNLPRTCVIMVPSGSLSAYTSAQYYPSSSTYSYVEY